MKFTDSLAKYALALGAGVACIATTNQAFADARQDFLTQTLQRRYFDLPQGARTFGMGGAGIATSVDSTATLQNPAGLGFMKWGEGSATWGLTEINGKSHPGYLDVENDVDYGHALVALPIVPTLDDLPEWGNVGMGWSGEDGEASLKEGPDGDLLDQSTWRLHLAYAKAIDANLSLGYGFSYVNDELEIPGNDSYDYEMDDGTRHNLGALWRQDNWALGGTVFVGFGSPEVDFGNGVDDDFDAVTWGIDLGSEHALSDTTLLVFGGGYTRYNLEGDINRLGYGLDGDEEGDSFSLRAGVEQTLTDWLKGRLGYRYQGNESYEVHAISGDDGEPFGDNDSAKYNALAFGAGAELGKWARLDYGAEFRWVGSDTGDWEHVLTLSVPFSLCREDWSNG